MLIDTSVQGQGVPKGKVCVHCLWTQYSIDSDSIDRPIIFVSCSLRGFPTLITFDE